jgi:hypothetical protein
MSTIAESTVKALENVVRYLYEDESDSYNACPGSHHIFNSVCILSDVTDDLENDRLFLIDAGTLRWLRRLCDTHPASIVDEATPDSRDSLLRQSLHRMRYIRDRLDALQMQGAEAPRRG